MVEESFSSAQASNSTELSHQPCICPFETFDFVLLFALLYLLTRAGCIPKAILQKRCSGAICQDLGENNRRPGLPSRSVVELRDNHLTTSNAKRATFIQSTQLPYCTCIQNAEI